MILKIKNTKLKPVCHILFIMKKKKKHTVSLSLYYYLRSKKYMRFFEYIQKKLLF